MPRAAPDASAHLAAIVTEIALIRERLARLEAATGLGPPGLAQDGRGADGVGYVGLKQAAGAWGVSAEAARKRAMRLVPLGLAEKRRPGGWRVRVEALMTA